MHISSRKLGSFGFCLVALILALPAMAQNRIIKGRVTNDKNEPIVGAMITIRSVESKNIFYNLKSVKNGEYLQMGLPASSFYIIVHAEGFAPSSAGPVNPSIAQDTVVNVTLAPGQDYKLPLEMSAQELEQAKKDYDKLEKRKQASAEVQTLFDSGRQLAEAGKHLEAIEEYKKAMEKDPEQVGILGYMAESYAKLNKDGEALEIYKKAIAIRPNDAALFTNMGVLLSKMGKSAESQEAFNKSVALNPAGAAQNYYNIAVTWFNSGKTAEASEAFKKSIASDPNFAESYYQLGMCLSASLDTMPEAIKALQQYVKIGKKPDQVDVAKQIIATLEDSLKKK
jgi:tetratricopeptide (TPR) repeat protein